MNHPGMPMDGDCGASPSAIFRLTLDILPIQGSVVPCERVFSSASKQDKNVEERLLEELIAERSATPEELRSYIDYLTSDVGKFQ
jgi:hypothetical protein